MSMYNLLFGQNPFSGLLLEMLGTTRDAIPRYRDCYLDENGRIVIHTRTGGGNRDEYEKKRQPEYNKDGPFNDDLRALPGFIDDEDDDFDSTYADFFYTVPPAFESQVAILKEIGGVQNPGERWQAMLTALRNGDTSSPEAKRALEVGERIMGEINAATKAGETGKIIEV